MKYYLSFFLIMFLATCDPNKPCGCSPPMIEPASIFLEYSPSQCNEPWHLAGAGGNSKEVIQNYLSSQKIVVNNISITPPPVDFITCAACTCSSGVLVTVSTNLKDEIVKLEKLGFKLKK